MQNEKKKVLLELRDVKQYFPVKKTKFREKQRYVRANDGITLDIYEGETLGLVGESGCGMCTLGRTVLHLDLQSRGDILCHKGEEVVDLKQQNYDQLQVLQQHPHLLVLLLLQDPYSSLNLRLTVGQLIREGL